MRTSSKSVGRPAVKHKQCVHLRQFLAKDHCPDESLVLERPACKDAGLVEESQEDDTIECEGWLVFRVKSRLECVQGC